MNATDRATALGTEHGTRAAEEWWGTLLPLDHRIVRGAFKFADVEWVSTRYGDWPQPDLNGYNAFGICGTVLRRECGITLDDPREHDDALYDALVDAYEEAFTDAVEATIRARCGGRK